MLISTTEFTRISENMVLKSIIEDNYLNNPNNENFIWMKDRYFDGDKNKAKLLTVSSGLGKSIGDTVAYYTGEPSINYKLDWNNIILDYEALSYFVIGLYRENGKLGIKYISGDGFTEEAGVYRSYTFYTVPSTSALSTAEYYVLENKYLDGYNENNLYKVSCFKDITSVATEAKKVPLDTITQTEDLQDIEKTGLVGPSIVVIKEDEIKEFKDLNSTIKATKNKIYSVDRKLTMVDTQFLQNVESFILMKGINVGTERLRRYNDGQKLDYKDMGKVIFGEPESSIDFIGNDNQLLKDAVEYEDKDIRRISSISKVPLDFLGISTKEGAIGVGSRSLIHGVFIKKIRYIRGKIDKALEELKQKGLQINNYEWEDVFAKSDNELIEELKIAREIKIISRERAIERYLKLDEKGVKEEIERLNLESNLLKNEENRNPSKGFNGDNKREERKNDEE